MPAAQQLWELCAGAYESFIHGWMSELPIEAELVRFAWKVLDAGRNVPGGVLSPAARNAAETAAADLGDPDVQAVSAAAYKVWKELDRLRGLLRFSPGPGGVHIARCAPDHFVLPGFAGHFTVRFGEAPWAIIDERRGLALVRYPGSDARLVPPEKTPHSDAAQGRDKDPWEDLWRSYHKVIANESRANPRLQNQFMPRRYWKYLPEKQD
jgi:probable DNA metabolism protein